MEKYSILRVDTPHLLRPNGSVTTPPSVELSDTEAIQFLLVLTNVEATCTSLGQMSIQNMPHLLDREAQRPRLFFGPTDLVVMHGGKTSFAGPTVMAATPPLHKQCTWWPRLFCWTNSHGGHASFAGPTVIVYFLIVVVLCFPPGMLI